MSTTKVKDLFELPENILKIHFVEELGRAVHDPQNTAQKYVVTDAIRNCFDAALTLVGSSLKNHRSQATYLHGSFGSGKSHFMALLSLMLDDNETAWGVPELHPMRKKAAFVGDKKLLQLHFHMLGKASLEDAVFRRYLDHVKEHHPDATIPGFFADEKLFDDARNMLDELGDDAFFSKMNDGAEPGGDDDWGDYDAEGTWDRARFDRCASSPDPKEREELFSGLVKTRFGSYAEETRTSFIDFDAGMSVMTRHAKELGYDAIVLYLDELILWLAGRASDAGWFNSEAQKMAKLIEADESSPREIPVVSFIARQRDLTEMVGEELLGVEDIRLRETLEWIDKGRFQKITIEDRNLPAIVEKRVLRAKDGDAKAELEKAFAKLKGGAHKGEWATMLGSQDEADFKRLYPFSPALVESLVALSNTLQRERTSIKLLTELLVEHIEDLDVGGIVGVGDLFDVLAGGEDTADGVMRARFQSAKQVYQYQFLPMLQAHHQTDTPEKCQRLRDDAPARIGCSNCPVNVCRVDNRLVKTLLVAALVPDVKVLKDLTASRLVQLNHGSLRDPIRGDSAALAAGKLRDWASKIGQLHVGTQGDPTVRLQLEGVELDPILERARHVDSIGARERVLRDLLFECVGLDPVADLGRDHKHKGWRGTDRLGHIRFGNVRKMGPEQLRCPDDHHWRLVIDFPFDEPGKGPHDDEKVIEEFKENHPGSWTLVWLPSFFSKTMNDMLGDLVVLDHILESDASLRSYISHLSVENQTRAKTDLENLRNQKRARLAMALERAYGLQAVKEGDLDTGLMVQDHLHLLTTGAHLPATPPSNLTGALDSYIPAILEARYPRHPRFTHKLTKDRSRRLLERFGELIDADDRKLPADKGLVEEMRGTLMEMGLVRVTETAIHLVEDRTLQEIEKRRQQAASERPEVGELRRYVDETGKLGLLPEAMDLVIRCYARWSARTFVVADRAFEPQPGKAIPDHVVLEKPDLPTHEDWNKAITAAGALFGVTLPGKALHADNLKRFETAVMGKVTPAAGKAAQLESLLQTRGALLGLDTDTDRRKTAASADALCTALHGKNGREVIETLAGFQAETSPRAVGDSLASVAETVKALDDELMFGPFEQLNNRKDEIEGAEELLEKVAATLRKDELNEKLAPRLKDLAVTANRLLNPPAPVGAVLYETSLHRKGRSDIVGHLEQMLEAVKAELELNPDDVVMTGNIRVTGKAKK